MSRVNSFFLVLLALSSVCFGATLMQISVARPLQARESVKEVNGPSDCTELYNRYHQKHSHNTARELYNEAFRLSFNGENTRAVQASQCAALLKNGTTRWAYETKDLINQH